MGPRAPLLARCILSVLPASILYAAWPGAPVGFVGELPAALPRAAKRGLAPLGRLSRAAEDSQSTGSLSEEDRAAALRLRPGTQQAQPEGGEEPPEGFSGDDKAREAALRLPSKAAQAELAAQRKDEEIVQQIMEINGSVDSMGPVLGSVYLLQCIVVGSYFLHVLSKVFHF